MRLIKDNVERTTETPEQIEKLKAMGFKNLDETQGGGDQSEQPKKERSALTVPELKALAKENGIEGAASLNKEELLAVLKDVI